jgi:hypothetical protein
MTPLQKPAQTDQLGDASPHGDAWDQRIQTN